MAATVRDVMAAMEMIAPLWMGNAGDPNGLHAGDPKSKVRKALVVLDATLPAIQEAIRRKCQMIVAHHPRFYTGLPNLDRQTMLGRIGYELSRKDIALYCAHTNLDTTPGGINDVLAELVGISHDGRCVQQTAFDPNCKLVVFVPDAHLEAVRVALSDAGAGEIGEYAECSFRTPGIGAFRGSAQSTPHLGRAGEYEEVEEWRLEMILPESRRAAVVEALRHSHPYEEPAFDLYRLETGTAHGCGRIGELTRSATLEGVARRIKKSTGGSGIRILGDPKRKLTRVAVWSGGGVPAARVAALAPDALVCGELGYHDAEVLAYAGVAAIILGHGQV